MRSFGGPDTYKLPIHGINRTHFETASRELDKFDVVLPLSNISQLPFLLGMPDVVLREVVSGHHAEQPKHPPTNMMRLCWRRTITGTTSSTNTLLTFSARRWHARWLMERIHRIEESVC